MDVVCTHAVPRSATNYLQATFASHRREWNYQVRVGYCVINLLLFLVASLSGKLLVGHFVTLLYLLLLVAYYGSADCNGL